MNRIEFSLEEYRPDWGRWSGVVPVVDGVSLVICIHDYETAQGFDLPGSYAGLVPPHADRVSAWVRYLLREVHPEEDEPVNGTTWLLGCGCSVAGCWPLEARVTVELDRITWDQFRQPHQPRQDYSTFGPFVFARDQYETAVAKLATALVSTSGRE